MRISLRFAKHVAGVAFLLLLLTGSASAQSGMGGVSGWVIDQTAALKEGKFVGIAGAKVQLSGTTVMTDKKGAYDVRETQDGTYTLEISAPGYEKYKLSISIGSDEIVSVGALLLKVRK
jgi:hypothetical protein